MADPVQLTDLDVITRYSIAVRAATADRDELLATLRADLAWLERGRPRSAPSYAPPRDYEEPAEDDAVDQVEEEPEEEEEAAARPPIRRMALPSTRSTTTKRTPAKKTAAKKTTAKKATKKAAPRR